jgi:hypothetical protein
MPCLSVCLFLISGIWLFRLDTALHVSGTFSSTEIAMTAIAEGGIGDGIGSALRLKKEGQAWPATWTFLLALALQFAAIWLSLRHLIAHR